MSFWWGSDVGDVFFKGLTVNTTGAMVALCLTLTVLSIVYEGMKVHGAKVRARAARERKRSGSCPPSESATLLSLELPPSGIRPLSRRICAFLAEATVFLFHNMLGYALMLTVMIYNGYLFVAVVGGMAIGYFLFGHLSMKVNMENVQARQTNVICTARCMQADSPDHLSHEPSELNSDGTAAAAGPSTSSSSRVTTVTTTVAVCH